MVGDGCQHRLQVRLEPAPEHAVKAGIARGSEAAWWEEVDWKIPAKGGTARALPAPRLLSRRRWLAPLPPPLPAQGDFLGLSAARPFPASAGSSHTAPFDSVFPLLPRRKPMHGAKVFLELGTGGRNLAGLDTVAFHRVHSCSSAEVRGSCQTVRERGFPCVCDMGVGITVGITRRLTGWG